MDLCNTNIQVCSTEAIIPSITTVDKTPCGLSMAVDLLFWGREGMAAVSSEEKTILPQRFRIAQGEGWESCRGTRASILSSHTYEIVLQDPFFGLAVPGYR